MPHLAFPRVALVAVLVAIAVPAVGASTAPEPAGAVGATAMRRAVDPPAIDLVTDLVPGRDSSSPGGIVDLNGVAIFAARTEYGGPTELFSSDGTAEGTRSLGVRSPDWLTVAGDFVYFGTYVGDDDYEVWRTDGTASGTTRLSSTASETGGIGRPTHFTAVGDQVYFRWAAGDWTRDELWVTDGTSTGTRQVTDRPGPYGTGPGELAAVGDEVWFAAYDDEHGRELWRSDGTEEGTVLVADVVPGVPDGEYDPATSSHPRQLTVVGDSVFFEAMDEDQRRKLWVSDGTSAGTRKVAEVSTRWARGLEIEGLTKFGGGVAYTANSDDAFDKRDLWVSDGTAAGTRRLTSGDVSTLQPVVMGDRLYFGAGDDHGYELWRSDGTRTGTRIVADLDPRAGRPAAYEGGPANLTTAAGRLFFQAADGVHGGYDLWSSSGTSSGTQLVEDLDMTKDEFGGGGMVERAHSLTAVGDDLFLVVGDSATGHELWSTAAGTASLPKMVAEVPPTVVRGATSTSPFRADPGQWAPATATFTYEWVVGTNRVEGATGSTFPADGGGEGTTLRVRVTASSPGHRTRSKISAPVHLDGQIVNRSLPRVTGTPRVGSTLTAGVGTWSPSDVDYSYRWLVDGVAVRGAYARTFVIPARARSHRVSVQVIATKPGMFSGRAVSAATAPAAAGVFRVVRRPTLTGTPQVGHRLTATAGSATPAAGRTTVRWLRDGRVIAGATGSTYRLRSADRGARIAAQVVRSRTGWRTLATASAPTSRIRA